MALTKSDLESLIHACRRKAVSPYEIKYVSELRNSLESLYASELCDSLESLLLHSDVQSRLSGGKFQNPLQKHLHESERHADLLLGKMCDSMRDGLRSKYSTIISSHFPRISSVFILRQLSHGGWDSLDGWKCLPEVWKLWVVAYGLALTEVQRAKRLIKALHNRIELERELRNEGHTNWNPEDYSESLLLEVESGIMIREVQEHIAAQMR